MNRLLKKIVRPTDIKSGKRDETENISMHTGNPKSSTRTPKWPEKHNEVFGELLMEQYACGNINDSIVRKEAWSVILEAFNRRLETNYTEFILKTRYKNMKCDFRMMYQLANRSGWGWDSYLHVPVASEEIWDELLRENPKLGRYRRNPFHQFEIFEKICGRNIALGDRAQSSAYDGPVIEEVPLTQDDTNDQFMASNGLSFTSISPIHPNVEEHMSTESQPPTRSKMKGKRAAIEHNREERRNRRQAVDEAIQKILERQTANSSRFTESLNKHCPTTMSECLDKLHAVPNITVEAVMAVTEAITQNIDNKTVLMKCEGDMLRSWIEHIVSTHPKFAHYPTWQ